MMTPPNTDVCNVSIPNTLAYNFSGNVSGINTPITTFIIKKPTVEAKAATPLSPVNPDATQIANNNGKFAKTISPALFITAATVCQKSLSKNGK